MKTDTSTPEDCEKINTAIETIMEILGAACFLWFAVFALVDLIDRMGWLSK